MEVLQGSFVYMVSQHLDVTRQVEIRDTTWIGIRKDVCSSVPKPELIPTFLQPLQVCVVSIRGLGGYNVLSNTIARERGENLFQRGEIHTVVRTAASSDDGVCVLCQLFIIPVPLESGAASRRLVRYA